jgi:AraC-like DNA-binding protein
VTPIQYRIKRRLNEACRHAWAEPTAPIGTLAMQSGFDSLPYFYRQYTACFGITPARHRLGAA